MYLHEYNTVTADNKLITGECVYIEIQADYQPFYIGAATVIIQYTSPSTHTNNVMLYCLDDHEVRTFIENSGHVLIQLGYSHEIT